MTSPLGVDVPLVDVNVYLERWPFRRLYGDTPEQLVAKLDEHGVRQAWCGSFDGLWQRDLAAVNERLAAACYAASGSQRLVPFGSINPKLPAWNDDLARCHEKHHMPGIRLHPNYHGYKLDDPALAELLAVADERALVVQIALSMEDERTQPALVQVPHVDALPLVEVLKGLPRLRVVMLNAFRSLRVEQSDKLASAGQVYFELAMLENVAGIERLLKYVPLDRVLFGSHFPFFYYESAVLKLRESSLAGGQLTAITHENSERLSG
ncbi:MAG TPA: amidohydrolase family protein [Pirellulales bacterium]|jgi:hypothetical protein|nr:amidohydrolase family protein [Pirellulales bacterium]